MQSLVSIIDTWGVLFNFVFLSSKNLKRGRHNVFFFFLEFILKELVHGIVYERDEFGEREKTRSLNFGGDCLFKKRNRVYLFDFLFENTSREKRRRH